MGYGLMLVAPNHTLDRLNVLRKGGVLYASNSLPFLLAETDEELDPDFLFYDSYISSIRLGLKRYEPYIPTRSGEQVRVYYCCNVMVDEGLEVVQVAKNPSPPFSGYADYKAYLDSTVSRIARNAADPIRAVRYAPLATVSKGYDSLAAMVVSTGVGCREAVTFRQSRGAGGNEDCGTPLAQCLGVTAHEFDRLGYRNHPDFPEIENSGGPNEFLSFGDSLASRLVITGFQGDKVWDKNCAKVSTDLVRSDASGSSLTEYRLRVGFCHLPVPFIGADRHPELHAIANSDEMKPWSLGNHYDRPIARRIVEDAGIPRNEFGQTKRAAGVVVTLEGLEATMGPRSQRDFADFCSNRWGHVAALKTGLLRFIAALSNFNQRGAAAASRLARDLDIWLPPVPYLFPRRLDMLASGYVGRHSLLFHWGVEKLIARYSRAIAAMNEVRARAADAPKIDPSHSPTFQIKLP
jgi:hypothetical protein